MDAVVISPVVGFEDRFSELRAQVLIAIGQQVARYGLGANSPEGLAFTEPWALAGSLENDGTPMAEVLTVGEDGSILVGEQDSDEAHDIERLDFENLLSVLDALENAKVGRVAVSC